MFVLQQSLPEDQRAELNFPFSMRVTQSGATHQSKETGNAEEKEGMMKEQEEGDLTPLVAS